MLRNKRGSIEWLEFEIFKQFPKVRHAIFLRHGEEFDFSFCNVGGGSESDKKNNQINLSRLKEIMQCSVIEEGFQVHGDVVKEAPLSVSLDKCDGLFTDLAGTGLMVKHADCQAAIFYDPVQ